MADKSCSEHIAGTMGHTGALSVDVDASGSFRGSLNRGLWERVCPYMWANYNVKPSTSKIENLIKLYRSQI